VVLKARKVGRPTQCRSVHDLPKVTCFKPEGVPRQELKSVLLTVDELEAIRLADMEGLHQAVAALKMNVSRPTFGRILEAGHKKVAEALVDGKQLCIRGGVIRSLCDSIPSNIPGTCVCIECGVEVPHNQGDPCNEAFCPQCGASLRHKDGCFSELQNPNE